MYQFRVVKIREVVIWPCNEFGLAKKIFSTVFLTIYRLSNDYFLIKLLTDTKLQLISSDYQKTDENRKKVSISFSFCQKKSCACIKIGTFSILFIFICLAESKSWKLIKLKTAGAENEKLIFPGHFSSDHISRFSLEVLNNSRTS